MTNLCNIMYKIKHKLYTASRSALPVKILGACLSGDFQGAKYYIYFVSNFRRVLNFFNTYFLKACHKT